MTEGGELKNIVEAALLVSEAPLSPANIMALFPKEARPTTEEVREVLDALERDCAGRGIELRKTGGGYRFWSRDRYAPWLRKLSDTRPPRYSRALLETLAIIAYRQPVTRGDIESIRGVTVSSDIMRVLLDRDWIKEIGKRDVPGRPMVYGTTNDFLAYFSLASLGDLPALDEKRELGAIASELNLELPAMEDESVANQGEEEEEEEEVALPEGGDDGDGSQP